MSSNGRLPRAATRAEGTPSALLELIGNTPLVALERIARDVSGVRLFAKAEWFNPGGSLKDRAAATMVAAAEMSGRLRPEVSLLDATSGNTGVAYAMIAAVKGYRATLCVPRNANPQVLGLLRAYRSDLVLTDPLQGSDGAIREARRLAAESPEHFLYLDQYNNPANWRAHYRTTAEEIWRQTDGTVTHFVAGLGTTGTFTGTSRRLKELNPSMRAIAVQPDAPFHGLEGLKHLESAITPGIYDPALPDETQLISTDVAYAAVQRLAEQEGILVGPSGGAALAAGLQVARSLAGTTRAHPATIVLIFPDAGARYAAEGLFAPAQRQVVFS